jgi:hypothetical protein
MVDDGVIGSSSGWLPTSLGASTEFTLNGVLAAELRGAAASV